MQQIPSPSSEPTDSSLANIIGQLLAATVVGAVSPLMTMARSSQHLKAEAIPTYMVAFGAVGFCAGLMLVLNDIAKKGMERSKSQGASVFKWKLLILFAGLLIIPVVIGFCLLMVLLVF